MNQECDQCTFYDRTSCVCDRWRFVLAINPVTDKPQKLLLCLEREDNIQCHISENQSRRKV